MSSLKLAYDSFTEQFGFKGEALLDYRAKMLAVDRFFTWAFFVEMLSKMIAKGIIMDENSYLRDSWN